MSNFSSLLQSVLDNEGINCPLQYIGIWSLYFSTVRCSQSIMNDPPFYQGFSELNIEKTLKNYFI